MWDWLFQFIDPLERNDIPYALVGSVASSIYGEPRATNDVDLVVHLRTEDAGRVVAAFPADRFYVPPEEVVQVEIGRAHGAHFNVIALEGMTKADLYPLAERHRAWFARRRSLEVAGRRIWAAARSICAISGRCRRNWARTWISAGLRRKRRVWDSSCRIEDPLSSGFLFSVSRSPCSFASVSPPREPWTNTGFAAQPLRLVSPKSDVGGRQGD